MKKKVFDPKMSDDKGSAAPPNVVKPTSNRSSASQGLENDNPTMSTNRRFLAPDTPPVLLAALSKEIEPKHHFTEPFGTVNKYGETILFELPVQVCFMIPSQYPKPSQVNRVSNGKVAIIFYPEHGKVLLIVNENDSFWPVETKSFLKNASGTCEDKFITHGCTAGPLLGCQTFVIQETTHKASCYLVNVTEKVYVTFCNEKDHNRFKNAIRNAQSRISKNRLPKNDIPETGSILAVSEFWYQTALRPCDFKLLFLHEAHIWTKWITMNNDGFVAIGQYKATKSLQLIILKEFVKNNCELSEDFTLIASDISSDTNNFVWEWFVACNHRHACGFKTAKEATDFKIIMDYYLDAWKKKSLSWDW